MQPIAAEACTDPDLAQALGHFTKTLGFVPNSLLTMQRVPAIAKAVIQLNRAVFAPDGEVDLGLKRLVAHVASTASGCQYCKAHTTVSATRHGVSDEKMAAIYDYATSPLYTPAERVALDFAMEAASVPNAVTDESYRALAEHWTETQIVELLWAWSACSGSSTAGTTRWRPRWKRSRWPGPRSSWAIEAGRPASTSPVPERYSGWGERWRNDQIPDGRLRPGGAR